MYELIELARQVGFMLHVIDGNHGVLTWGTWERRFHHAETLRDFLKAAQAGQALRAMDYVTQFDAWHTNNNYKMEQYAKGRKLADSGAIIYIGATGAWSAEVPPEHAYQTGWSSVSAYEVIGGHACTMQLLLGWQDGMAPIIDYRAVYA